jgi:hypothetical protein
MPNPNKWAIFIPTIIASMVVKGPMEKYSIEIFMKLIPVRKFPIGSDARQNKA